MISFKPFFLATTLLSLSEANLRSNRQLSNTLIAGFEPETDVSDHARLDLDAAYMETMLDTATDLAFTNAKSVYTNGGHSKSVATVTIPGGLSNNVEEEDEVTGENEDGHQVVLKAYATYSGADNLTAIELQYVTDGCYVGGLPSSDRQTGGCLKDSGAIVIGNVPYTYTYDKTADNRNVRTLQGFSTTANTRMRPDQDKDPYFEEFQKFVDYYGDYDYADRFVQAAFGGKKTDFTNSLVNFDFGVYSGDLEALAEAVQKGAVYMAVAMYVIRELEDAIYDCENCSGDDCNDDAVHALDEAVAFYAGSLEGTDGSGDGVMVYALAEKRSPNFKTGGPNGDSVSGTSKVNLDIFREFKNMQSKLMVKDCTAARVHRERIGQLIFIPMIQGTLRYAYITGTDPESTNKAEAEGVAFAASVLPIVNACNSVSAQTIHDMMKPGVPNSMDSFKFVKAAFESNYGCMKITCADVGGYWDEANGQYYEGAGPCGSSGSSSVNVGLAVGLSIGGLVAVLLVCLYCKFRKRNDVEFKGESNPVA